MFGRDKAIDPLAEAQKALAAAKGRAPATSTEFARSMLTDESAHAAAVGHAPASAQRKPVAPHAPAAQHRAVADPEVVQAIERMLGRLSTSGWKPLDARLKAALLKNLTPEQQATIAKLADRVPSGKTLAIIVFAIFVALQVIPGLIGSLIGR